MQGTLNNDQQQAPPQTERINCSSLPVSQTQEKVDQCLNPSQPIAQTQLTQSQTQIKIQTPQDNHKTGQPSQGDQSAGLQQSEQKQQKQKVQLYQKKVEQNQVKCQQTQLQQPKPLAKSIITLETSTQTLLPNYSQSQDEKMSLKLKRGHPELSQLKKDRCNMCDRKTCLLGHECGYCKTNFCSLHRLPEDHDCSMVHLCISRKRLKQSLLSGKVVKKHKGKVQEI